MSWQHKRQLTLHCLPTSHSSQACCIMQMNEFDCYYMMWHWAERRLQRPFRSFSWLHSTVWLFNLQLTQSLGWMFEAAAVRSVADSRHSENTASSSTLPHCHRQLRGRRLEWMQLAQINLKVWIVFMRIIPLFACLPWRDSVLAFPHDLSAFSSCCPGVKKQKEVSQGDAQ